MLSFYRSGLQSYASSHPDLALDPTLASVPSMSWEAKIEQSRFVELVSFSPAVIRPDPGGLNWVSLGPDWNEARVYARTSTGPGAVVIPQPGGFEYTGGAFGEQVGRTPTASVWVQPNLVIQLTMPSSVQDVDFQPMTVKAGYEVPAGGPSNVGLKTPGTDGSGMDTVWSANILLTFNAGGGIVEQPNGVTNVAGEYSTGLRLSTGSSQVTVSVLGKGDVDSRAEVNGLARVDTGEVEIDVIARSQAELLTYAGVKRASNVVLDAPAGMATSDISSLSALGSLEFIRTALYVNNSNLADVSYLAGVTAPPRAIGFTNNDGLTGLHGLTNMRGNTGQITISGNDRLPALTGLEGLTSADAGVYIEYNPLLVNLAGLDYLERVGDIWITENLALGSLEGLGRVRSVNNLNIMRGTGSGFTFRGMNFLDSVYGSFRVQAGGSLLGFEGPSSLAGFPDVSYLNLLIISDCDKMTSLDGFSSTLTSIGGLQVGACDLLTSFDGMGALTEVRGDVTIEHLPSLTSLSGISGVKVIGGNLKIYNCRQLPRSEVDDWLAGLTVGGTISIDLQP